ncbi:succinyl-CoA--3-ketoacid-CoA transferase, partial [bacterium]|nr:succinyl-CoA--3-ketoacid-CoA transferase [bacterium]
MIRGGHVDAPILGAMEVSQDGNIANYMIPGKLVKGMGGAMDLVAGSKNVIVAMMHCSKDGVSKILKECSLPLTGIKCVNMVVTDLGVLEVHGDGFILRETAEGVSVEDIKESTEANLIISPNCQEGTY